MSYRHGLFDGWPCTTGAFFFSVSSPPRTNKVSPCNSSFPFLRHLCLALVFRRTFMRTLLLLVRVLGHDVLKVTPQRLDGRELVSDRCDFFERAIQLVDVLQDDF
jgi:hypothetical protein